MMSSDDEQKEAAEAFADKIEEELRRTDLPATGRGTMEIGPDRRQPDDDTDPREILERAVERLPVEERGRAREALEAMAGPDEQAREIAALYDAVDELQDRLARALDWLNAANRRSHIVEDLLDTYRRLRQGNIRQVRYLDDRLEELAEAADAVVEASAKMGAADTAAKRMHARRSLQAAIDEYRETRSESEDTP